MRKDVSMHAVILDPTTPDNLVYYAEYAPGVQLHAPEDGDPASLLAPDLGGGSGGARMKQARDTFSNLARLRRGEALTHVVS